MQEADLGIPTDGWSVVHGDDGLAIGGDLDGTWDDSFTLDLGGTGKEFWACESVTGAAGARGDGPRVGEEPFTTRVGEQVPLRTLPDSEFLGVEVVSELVPRRSTSGDAWGENERGGGEMLQNLIRREGAT